MAVEARCRNGSVQALQTGYTKAAQAINPIPTSFLTAHCCTQQSQSIAHRMPCVKMMSRWGYKCSLCKTCL